MTIICAIQGIVNNCCLTDQSANDLSSVESYKPSGEVNHTRTISQSNEAVGQRIGLAWSGRSTVCKSSVTTWRFW